MAGSASCYGGKRERNLVNVEAQGVQRLAPTVQGLWIGNALSRVEKLCISSFLSQGHSFDLYTYGNVEGIPDGATVHDGREILPEKDIFLNSDRKTYAGFANFFGTGC